MIWYDNIYIDIDIDVDIDIDNDWLFLFFEKSRVDYLASTKSVENSGAKSFNKNTQAH